MPRKYPPQHNTSSSLNCWSKAGSMLSCHLHPILLSEIAQTRQHFSSFPLYNFGDLVWIVASVFSWCDLCCCSFFFFRSFSVNPTDVYVPFLRAEISACLAPTTIQSRLNHLFLTILMPSLISGRLSWPCQHACTELQACDWLIAYCIDHLNWCT